MSDLGRLRVAPFAEGRVSNPYPGGELPWRVYHAVRNGVVRACRRHGPTGPMGECAIDPGRAAPDIRSWGRGDKDPDYFILDDQLNHERYLYDELYGRDHFNS